jgi:uncharacterized peroxidase-related enzyme
MVDKVAEDWRSAGLDGATNALLEFAEKLTRNPSSIRPSDIGSLREQGFDDEGISSVTQVVAYFNYINRIAEGLGVAAEPWLGEDGRRKEEHGEDQRGS